MAHMEPLGFRFCASASVKSMVRSGSAKPSGPLLARFLGCC